MVYQNLCEALKTAFQNTGCQDPPGQRKGHGLLQRPEPLLFAVVHTDISDIIPVFHNRELHQGSRFSQFLALRNDGIQNLQFTDPVAGQHFPVPEQIQIPVYDKSRSCLQMVVADHRLLFPPGKGYLIVLSP